MTDIKAWIEDRDRWKARALKAESAIAAARAEGEAKGARTERMKMRETFLGVGRELVENAEALREMGDDDMLPRLRETLGLELCGWADVLRMEDEWSSELARLTKLVDEACARTIERSDTDVE